MKHKRHASGNTSRSTRHKLPEAIENPLLAEARHLRLKKRFSQNFLVDQSVINRIVGAVAPEPTDTIIEIGPGAGFLTQALLPVCQQLLAIELERNMVAYLRQKFAQSPNLSLLAQDVLRVKWEDIGPERFHVVGNLPYAITTPILFSLVGELDSVDHALRHRMQSLTLMVQKEVAERLTAEPNTPGYNALSIAAQCWFDAQYCFTVPSQAFYPSPKVQSAVIQLQLRPQSLVPADILKPFAKLVRAGFQFRRKTLLNALQHSQIGTSAQLVAMFNHVQAQGILPGMRAQELSIADFVTLTQAYLQVFPKI